MGHVIAIGVELHCPVHGFFKDAQKLWCDLFLARHGRFHGCLRKLSGSSFELTQDLSYFHARHPITLILCGALMALCFPDARSRVFFSRGPAFIPAL
jgi:hypothetical protein